jgi:hypothetical protein
MISLPDTHIVYSLLREAPGPSPWWCREPIASSLGPLVWKRLDQPPGFSALLDWEGQPRLALPMYTWFQVLSDGWMLLWSRQPSVGEIIPSPILVHLLNVDYLRRLVDLDRWLAQKPAPVDPYLWVAPEFRISTEIRPAYPPGKHELLLPPAFDRVPEFFVVADNPVLPKQSGNASFCIYAIDPAARSIEVFPQDWFNDGTPDYGYQWITCATRDPATYRLLVSGFRIDNFVLDETGRQIELRLPR